MKLICIVLPFTYIHMNNRGMSANAEDITVYDAFFSGAEFRGENHTYMEIGAHDGVRESNSRFYDICLGWNGLLVEPHPKNYERTLHLRPNAHHLGIAPSCMANASGTVLFHKHMWTSAQVIKHEANSSNEKGSNIAIRSKIEIHCGPLQYYLDALEIRHIDFWSLDVEGSELKVLETVDFERTHIDVIIAESANRLSHLPEIQKKVKDVRLYLQRRGYLMIRSVKVPKSDVFLHRRACGSHGNIQECNAPLPHVKQHGQAASCTFCNILNEPDLVVTGTGGNTCGSIQLMAAKEVNGSEICATLQKEEGVCCPGPEPASQQGPVHQRSEESIVRNRPAHEQVGASQPEKKGSSEKEEVLERTKCTFCKGGFPNPDMIVPQTGGNTCCSIQMLAVEEYNATDTCEILRKQENVCCPEPEQSTHLALALEAPSDNASVIQASRMKPVTAGVVEVVNDIENVNVAIHVMGGSGLCSQLMMLLVSQLYYEKACHRNFMVDESFFGGYRRSSSEGVLTGFFTPQVPVLDEVKDRSIFAKKWLPVSAQRDPFWALPLEGGFRKIATSSPNSIKDAVGSETPLVISGVFSHQGHFRSGWKKLCKMQKTDDMLQTRVDWHYLYYSLIPYACNNFQFNNHTQNEIKAHLLEHNISTSPSNQKMVAFHIRRSDKVRTRESLKYTAKTYVEKWINSLGEMGDTTAQSFTHCFIASDEFAAVEEFRAVLDDQQIPCHVLTLTPTARRGTSVATQAKLGYAESLTFLAEMSVLVEAEYFVGTMGSNVGAFVTLMRSCPAFFRGEKFKDYKEELTKNHYYNSFGVDTDWYIRVD